MIEIIDKRGEALADWMGLGTGELRFVLGNSVCTRALAPGDPSRRKAVTVLRHGD